MCYLSLCSSNKRQSYKYVHDRPLYLPIPPTQPTLTQQRYEAIDWGKAVDTKLPESELAADKAEKEALLRDGQAIVKAAEALIAETQVCGGGVLLWVGGGWFAFCGWAVVAAGRVSV